MKLVNSAFILFQLIRCIMSAGVVLVSAADADVLPQRSSLQNVGMNSFNSGDICKYCKFCDFCSKCPCEGERGCEHCDQCKYCWLCSFCPDEPSAARGSHVEVPTDVAHFDGSNVHLDYLVRILLQRFDVVLRCSLLNVVRDVSSCLYVCIACQGLHHNSDFIFKADS